MLARKRERGIDVGSSISAATGALGGGSLCCRLDNPHGWLWLLGECDCLSVPQARRHKKASITLPNYHKYAAHTM